MSVAETRNPNTFKSNRPRKKLTAADKRQYGIAMKAIADKDRKEVERKQFRTELDNQAIPDTGFISQLSAPSQGANFSQRIGDDISMKGITIRFQLTHGDSINMVRVMVLKWFDAGSPLINSLLAPALSGFAAPLRPILWENRRKFRVLYDNLYAISTNTNSNIVEKIYLKNLGNAQFTPGGTANERGSIYILFLSDSSAVVHPDVDMITSLTYTDG